MKRTKAKELPNEHLGHGRPSYLNMEDLFLSLLVRPEATSQRTQGATTRAWLRTTVRAIINLPWGETNLPDDHRPPQHDTAA